MKEMTEEEKAKQDMIQRFKEFIENQGTFIMRDGKHNINYKISQMDVLINITKFLDNYNEHIKVLNKYIQDNKWKQNEKGDR